jgi:hypothetical protein
MDWFSTWDPVFYAEIDQVDPAVDTGRLTAWLILAVVALAVAALWYRQRVFRHSFWCATIGRDVEVCFRLGRVRGFTTRRCAFRRRWDRAAFQSPGPAQAGAP